MLLGRADGEHDPVVSAQVGLELHPVEVADPHRDARTLTPKPNSRLRQRARAAPARGCDDAHALLRRRAALALDRVAHAAVRAVVVDDAARLHRRVDRRRADEAEARLAQALRQLDRRRRLRLPRPPAPGRRGGTPTRARAAACPPRAARASPARSRSPPRSCRGGGRCPRRRAAARRRARRTARPRRDRSRRTPRGSSRACAGSSATRARTGSPRGRAARTARARRAPAVPTPRRGTRCTPGRCSPSSERRRRSRRPRP